MSSRIALLLLALAALPTAGCGSSSASPTPVKVAVIRVGDEAFRVALPTPELVEAARAAQAGTGPRIPNGRIVAGTQVNVGYSWHLEDLGFADVTIELCDGRPSMVEREGVTFGGGRFCPWGAEVVSIN
ncbi:MAG TPA: hypothetical protein VF198_11550 [Vicinamibacterales bacterium]